MCSLVSFVLLMLLSESCSGYEYDNSSILDILLNNYNNDIPPFHFKNAAPLNVSVGAYILEFYHISDTDMDYRLTFYFRRSWTDHRMVFSHLSNESSLAYDSKVLPKLWSPDIYFVNEKSAKIHQFVRPNTMVWLYSDGRLFVSTRYTMTLSCPMKLHYFPMDQQVCHLTIESYSYSKKYLVLHWLSNPIEMPDDMNLIQFEFEGYYIRDCSNSYSTGSYPCLQVSFHLKRRLVFYIISTYVPSMFIVVVSWVSFWFSIDAVPGRIALGATTVLTVVTQGFIASLSQPRVPYTKAVDVWFAFCLLFVFSSLVGFAVANYSYRKEIARSQEYAISKDEGKKETEVDETTAKSSKIYKSQRIDNAARLLFPCLFLVFNLVYWGYYAMMAYH